MSRRRSTTFKGGGVDDAVAPAATVRAASPGGPRRARRLLAGATAAAVLVVSAGLLSAGAATAVPGSDPARAVGALTGWGDTTYSQLSMIPHGKAIVAVAAEGEMSMVLNADGTVSTGGSTGGHGITSPVGLGDVTAIAAGYTHLAALTEDKTVHAWDAVSGAAWVSPAGLEAVAIAATFEKTAAVTTDGTVVVWDRGGSPAMTVPQGLSGVAAVVLREERGLALRANGTVVSLGTDVLTEPVPGLADVIDIALTSSAAFALKADGTVVAWGDTAFHDMQVPAGLTGVTAIEAGLSHVLALKADGTVVAWGSYDPAASTPPAGLDKVIAIAAGRSHSLAIQSAAPSFANASPPTGAVVNESFEDYTFSAGGLPAPTFSISDGALPAGLTLSAAGRLSGMPTAVGTFPYTVRASNGVGSAPTESSHTITVTSRAAFTAESPATTVLVDTAYSYTFAAAGSPAPEFTIGTGSLPTGLALDSATGVLSGTPTETGQFTYTVRATNVNGSVSTGTNTLDVQSAPVLTADAPATTAQTGTAYSYTFAASGWPAPGFSVTGLLPTGLSLHTGTGVLSGTPTVGGLYTFTVTANNWVGSPAVGTSHQMTVAAVPAFTASTPPAGAVAGTAYNYAFATSGYPAPDFAVSSGSLPAGLELSAGGVLSGTPTETGSFEYTVSATNDSGTKTTAQRALTVSSLPALTADAPPAAGLLGTGYEYTFAATGYPAPTFAIFEGALPAGLLLSDGGELSGTPTETGVFSYRVTAGNGTLPNAVGSLHTLTVSSVPELTADAPPATGLTGTAYEYTFAASGYPAPSFSITGGALPAGLALSSAGVLSGTPTETGVFSYRVTAANGFLPNSVGSLHTLTVSSVPAFTSSSAPAGSVGDAYGFTFEASGFPVPTFAVTDGELPAGLALSAAGELSGTPTTVGSSTFTVTAANSVGSVDVELTIVVAPGALAEVVVAPQSEGSDSYTVTAGQSLTFTATGRDASGNPISGLVASFATTQDAGETADLVADDTITFYAAGTRTVTATIDGVSTTIEVTVLPAAPVVIALSASSMTVARGGSITLSVAGTDAHGNPVGDLSDQVVFSSDQPTDVISGNTVTFPHASPHVITATLGELTSSVLVEVQETAVVPPVVPPVVVEPAAPAAPVVVPAADVPAALVTTGVDAGGLLLPGLALLLLGLGVTVGIRRRQRA